MSWKSIISVYCLHLPTLLIVSLPSSRLKSDAKGRNPVARQQSLNEDELLHWLIYVSPFSIAFNAHCTLFPWVHVGPCTIITSRPTTTGSCYYAILIPEAARHTTKARRQVYKDLALDVCHLEQVYIWLLIDFATSLGPTPESTRQHTIPTEFTSESTDFYALDRTLPFSEGVLDTITEKWHLPWFTQSLFSTASSHFQSYDISHRNQALTRIGKAVAGRHATI